VPFRSMNGLRSRESVKYLGDRRGAIGAAQQFGHAVILDCGVDQRLDDPALPHAAGHGGRVRTEIERRAIVEKSRAQPVGRIDQFAAVLDRQLRNRHLVRGQEVVDIFDCRQLLFDRRVGGANIVVANANTGNRRHAGVDLVESAHANFRHRRSVGRGGGRDRIGLDHHVGAAAEQLEGQEELVAFRALLEGDNGAGRRQYLATFGAVVGCVDQCVEGSIGLSDDGFATVDANAHPHQIDIVGGDAVVQNNKKRAVEQVAVAVKLADRKHDVTVGQRDVIADVEQQKKLFADADTEIRVNLSLRERSLVNRHQPQAAGPVAIARCLVAQHQCEIIRPAGQVATAYRVDIVGKHAIHVNAPAVGGVEGNHHVLQGGLQVLVGIGRRQCRIAVAVGAAAAMENVVVVQSLAKGEIARGVGPGIADDIGVFLHHVGGYHPGFDAVLAGQRQAVAQLFTGAGQALRLAAIFETDAPAADPVDLSAERQIDRGLGSAGIKSGSAGAGFEFVQRDHVGLVAAAC